MVLTERFRIQPFGDGQEERPADLDPELRGREHELTLELTTMTRHKETLLQDRFDFIEELFLSALLETENVGSIAILNKLTVPSRSHEPCSSDELRTSQKGPDGRFRALW